MIPEPTPHSAGRLRPRWLLLSLWGAGVFLLALRPIESFDTFWQLQSGKYIWQTGQFLSRDTFSLAADAFRLEHCWLHDLVLYGLYLTGGYSLLGLLKPLLIAVCAVLLLRASLREGAQPLVAAPVLLLCLAASADSWLVRPQLWTFLGGVLFLVILYRGRRQGWKTWLWLVPLMVVWANLHAACILGFALLAAFWVGELWRVLRGQGRWRDLGLLTGCSSLVFAAAFLNPYGYHIPLDQLLGHLNQVQVQTGSAPLGMVGNMEWLPPSFDQVPWFYVVMTLWAVTLAWRLWRRRLEVAELGYFLGFSYMGFSQIRHTTLVALLAGFFLPLAVQSCLGEIPALKGLWRWHGVRAWLPGMLLLAVLVGAAAAHGRLGLGLRSDQYPVAAADFVRAQKPPGNLYNAYDWGGYLMWRLFPDYRVYVDGRSDSPVYFAASTRIENGLAGWRQDLAKDQVNTILTRTCFYDTGGPQALIDNLVASPDWTLVHQDQVAVVFVRNLAATLALRERFGLPSRLAYRTMLAEARRLQAEDGARPRSWLAIGRAAFGLGDGPKALQAYQHYLETAPENREARERVAFLQQLLGKPAGDDR